MNVFVLKLLANAMTGNILFLAFAESASGTYTGRIFGVQLKALIFYLF